MKRRESINETPRIAEKLLMYILPENDREDTVGDFEEIYQSVLEESGKFSAVFWYWRQLFAYLPGHLYINYLRNFPMLKNLIRMTFRNIAKHKSYSFINIAGLAVGMASSMLILLWVQDEVSTNRFHRNLDHIFWLTIEEGSGEELFSIYCSPPAAGPVLKDNFPEIRESVRIANAQPTILTDYKNRKFNEKIQFADISVFTVFSFPLVQGEADIENENPYIIFISERTALKYFGTENPIGKSIRLDNNFDVTVSGVFKNTPRNSTIQFEMLMPLDFLNVYRKPGYTSSWSNYTIQTYFLVQEQISPQQLNEKMKDSLSGIYPESDYRPVVHPFQDFYLVLMENNTGVRMFSAIASVILLIACINFTNLTTARSAKRAREVGIRKATGADRKQLFRQFMGESFLLTVIAAVAAILIASSLLPLFTAVTGKHIELHSLLNVEIISGLIIITVITAVFSGSYPALILSRFRPASVLKGSFSAGQNNSRFRKILVITQFTLAIILILMTTMIYRQLSYMENKDLGFNRDQVLYLRLEGNLLNSYRILKEKLLKHPGVVNASLSSDTPSYVETMWNGWEWEGKTNDDNYAIPYIRMDADFDKVFSMKLAYGRFFDGRSGSREVLVNEEFTRMMGVDNPTGQYIRNTDDPFRGDFRIAGVIRDFHYRPVNEGIDPLIIFHEYENIGIDIISLKINPDEMLSAINHIEAIWKNLNPEFPFEYHFLDEDYEKFFVKIKQLDTTFRSFALIAILISALGLFGLTSFITEQRKKEIGIRKVLGSSVSGIVSILSKEFIICVVFANIIAWPAAYYLMSQWLQDFAYRAEIEISAFLFSALCTLVIAGMTICYQTVKAANANPVNALKHE